MCDTLVVPAKDARRGRMLFAKNSDRERNEAQGLEWSPARRSPEGQTLRATYILVPEIAQTHACVLSRPFWTWGAEMGANEHGVVIGNEAMHAKAPASRRRALIGMDLVRLGLERGADALEALGIMTALLERHGQGGDCGHLARFYYQNGFIIADPKRAFVLETVGRDWVAQEVQAPRALSNAYSITGEAFALSAPLWAEAKAHGWAGSNGHVDFAGQMIDLAKDAVSFGQGRCARATGLMAGQPGAMDVLALMAVLRDHGAGSEEGIWSPDGAKDRTICMHAGPGARRSQSVASMVSEVWPGGGVHWVTASSSPCLSIFKPVLKSSGPPAQEVWASGHADPHSRWWRHERFHRRALERFPEALAAIRDERDALEFDFTRRIDAVEQEPVQQQQQVMADCWRDADALEERWSRQLEGSGRGPRSSALHRSWARLNQTAGFRL